MMLYAVYVYVYAQRIYTKICSNTSTAFQAVIWSFIFSTSGSPMAESKPAQTRTKSGQNCDKESRVQINNLQHLLTKCEFSKTAYLVCDWQEDVTEE